MYILYSKIDRPFYQYGSHIDLITKKNIFLCEINFIVEYEIPREQN